jgi:hypothetical protein
VKTPLKPSLDDEIYEVEQRLQRRREQLPLVARATGRSALHTIASPAGLAVAALLGFVVGGGLRRSEPKAEARWVKVEPKAEKAKGVALGSLAMSAAVALIKAQYGSPLDMARTLYEKVQSRKKTAAPSPVGDRRRVAG